MASYVYAIPGVNGDRLQRECLAAGLPVTSIGLGGIGSPDVSINTSRDLTAQEVTTLDGVVAAHDGRPRQPRPFVDLYNQITALTTTQKAAINADLFGSANKWAADVTANRGALAVLWLLTQLQLTPTQTAAARVAGAALYCQDFPAYLINPPFAPSVNVPGDEPAPAAAP